MHGRTREELRAGDGAQVVTHALIELPFKSSSRFLQREINDKWFQTVRIFLLRTSVSEECE